jgi:hypothetical protein
VENGQNYSTETVYCKHPQPSVFDAPLDILGGGHRWPNNPPLARGLWAAILHNEISIETDALDEARRRVDALLFKAGH